MEGSFWRRSKKLLQTGFGILIVAIYLFPVYWVFATSLKPMKEIFQIPPTMFPQHLTTAAYRTVIEVGVVRNLLNSLKIAIPTTLLTMVMAISAAYVLARMASRLTNWLLLLFLGSQLMPPVLMATPMFVIFHKMHLTNTFLAVILAITTVTLPFSIILLRPTFAAIPAEIEDSAQIDGCSWLGVLFYIVIPVARAGIAVATAISFLWSYSNFVYPVSFLNREEMFPTTVGLYNFLGAQTTNWSNVMAFAMVVSVPAIFVFLAFHKQLVKGISAGAIK